MRHAATDGAGGGDNERTATTAAATARVVGPLETLAVELAATLRGAGVTVTADPPEASGAALARLGAGQLDAVITPEVVTEADRARFPNLALVSTVVAPTSVAGPCPS